MADEQTTPDPPSESTPAPASDPASDATIGNASQAQDAPAAKKAPKAAAKKASKQPAKQAPTKATKASKTAKATKASEPAERAATTGDQPAGEAQAAEGRPAPRKGSKAAKAPAKAPAEAPAKATTQDSSRPRPRPTPRKQAQPPMDEPARRTERGEAPVEPAEAQPAEAQPAQAQPRPAPGSWAQAALAAVQEPDQPPLRLAELAVAELGPRAADWADWLRRTYPGAPADGIARLAARQARRQTWGLLATEAAGPLAPALHLSGTAAVRVLLVLRTAAAYGYDPTEPDRASEVLDLLGLGGAADAMERMALVGSVLGRFGRRRRLTGALRLLLALSEEHESVERLAHRAARHYRRQETSGAAAGGGTASSAVP